MQDKGDRNGVINHFVQFLQGHTYRGVSFLQAGSRCIGIEPLWVIASLKKFSWRFWPQNTHGKCEKTFFFSVLVTDFNRTCSFKMKIISLHYYRLVPAIQFIPLMNRLVTIEHRPSAAFLTHYSILTGCPIRGRCSGMYWISGTDLMDCQISNYI